jgi:hypothetical protein
MLKWQFFFGATLKNDAHKNWKQALCRHRAPEGQKGVIKGMHVKGAHLIAAQ